MNIWESWKSSLQLFKWSNFTSFLLSVWASLPIIWARWFIYCGWALFMCAMLLVGLVYFLDDSIQRVKPVVNVSGIPWQGYALIIFIMFIVLAILLSYAALILYIIVKQAYEKKRSSVFAYKRHGIWAGGIVFVLLLVVVYFVYMPMLKSLYAKYIVGIIQKVSNIESIRTEFIGSLETLKETIRRPLEHLTHELQKLSAPFSENREPLRFLDSESRNLVGILFAINGVMILGMLIVILFFLRASPTSQGLGRSLRNAIFFILYNLPALCIFYLILFALIAPLGFFSSYWFISTGLLLPFCVTLYSFYCYKRIEEQPNLYR